MFVPVEKQLVSYNGVMEQVLIWKMMENVALNKLRIALLQILPTDTLEGNLEKGLLSSGKARL